LRSTRRLQRCVAALVPDCCCCSVCASCIFCGERMHLLEVKLHPHHHHQCVTYNNL
jgi:hypothetical protein